MTNKEMEEKRKNIQKEFDPRTFGDPDDGVDRYIKNIETALIHEREEHKRKESEFEDGLMNAHGDIALLKDKLKVEREEHARTRGHYESACREIKAMETEIEEWELNSCTSGCEYNAQKLQTELNTARERIKELELTQKQSPIYVRETPPTDAEKSLVKALTRIAELEKPGAIEQDVLEDFMAELESWHLVDPEWGFRKPNIIREFVKEREGK